MRKLRRTNNHKKLTVLLVMFFMSIGIFSQQTITGKITDQKGNPIPGVNVMEKGTGNGTATDMDGSYSLSVSGPEAKLVITSVGFSSQELEVGSRNALDIEMKEESTFLDEVFVTALGVKRASRDIGFAVQDVKGDDLKKTQGTNALNSLVGKVAGLTVSTSAEMLGMPDLILRGSGDVLIIVDGVPVNSDGYNFNPNDIESYTVLKGPNAAALYGFRGQSGAVIITTKKSTEDRVAVEFNSSSLIDAGFISLLETQKEYGIGSNYQYAFGGVLDEGGKYTRTNIWGPRFEGQNVAQWNSPIDAATGERTGTPFNAYPNNLENYLETGFQTSNNLSVSTSTDKFFSRISLGHTHQKYMLPNTKLDMFNANIYTGYKINNRLSVEGNLNYSKQYSPNVPQVWYGPNSVSYMFGVYGSAHWNLKDMENYWMPGLEGVQQQFAEYGRANNPYFLAYEWTREHNKTDIHGFLKVDYEIMPGLNASLRSQVTTWDYFRDEKVPYSANKYGREQEKAGDYEEDRRNMFENNTDLLLTYNTNIGSFLRISALAGGNIRTFKYSSNWGTTDYLVVPGVYNFSNSLNPVRIYNYRSEMQVNSAYASMDISLMEYLTLSASGRLDKLSTLPEGNNAFFYPSLTLSTMVTDYVKLPEFITSIKPRVSYANVKGGLTSSRIGPAFVALGYVHPLRPSAGWFYFSETVYNGPAYTNQDVYNTSILYESAPSVSLSSTMANPALEPYSVDSYEGGIEVGLFKNRVYIDLTYFTMFNGPQIFEKTAAPSTGFLNEMVNGIVTKKSGYEVALNLVPILTGGGLQWQIGLNYGNFKEVLHEGLNEEGATFMGQRYKTGDRMDVIYGTKYNRTAEGRIIHDAAGMPVFSPKGDAHLKELGYVNPDFVWGVINNITYKNINLGFQFDGRVGGIMFSELHARQFQSGNSPVLVEGELGEARRAEWDYYKENAKLEGKYLSEGVKIVSGTPEFENGYITNIDELELAENDEQVRVQAFATQIFDNVSEHFVVSKTYSKLREVSLGYTLPSKVFGNRINQMTISLVGKNLLYFAEHKSTVVGMDMDQYGEGFDVARKSITFRAPHHRLQSPTTRQVGVNINIKF
jgi:TonB-linked SusC/RagA family outer membrane protein